MRETFYTPKISKKVKTAPTPPTPKLPLGRVRGWGGISTFEWNGGGCSGINSSVKTLSALLVVTLFCGCASPSTVWKSAFHKAGNLTIKTFENNTGFELVNSTGKELHDVTMKVWVRQGITWYDVRGLSPSRHWSAGDGLKSDVRFNYGIDEIEVSGRTDVGTIKGYWTAEVSFR